MVTSNPLAPSLTLRRKAYTKAHYGKEDQVLGVKHIVVESPTPQTQQDLRQSGLSRNREKEIIESLQKV